MITNVVIVRGVEGFNSDKSVQMDLLCVMDDSEASRSFAIVGGDYPQTNDPFLGF